MCFLCAFSLFFLCTSEYKNGNHYGTGFKKRQPLMRQEGMTEGMAEGMTEGMTEEMTEVMTLGLTA
jgi:hypothetical protein